VAGTFLGLQPAVAWAIRFSLIIAYALFTAYWVFRGWLVYREHYREADWTPTDDIVDNLRGHRWGQFGLIVLIVFLTMATFGSALAPSTVDQNIQSPYAEENQIQYLSEEGTVETVFAGDANFNSKSKGAVETNVGVMSYDDYSRFHPFGTLPNGRDLFTFMMGGARITMIVSGMAITGAAGVAMTLSMLSAYYRGSLDLGVLTVSDGVVSIPQLLLLIMVSAVFADTWLGGYSMEGSCWRSSSRSRRGRSCGERFVVRRYRSHRRRGPRRRELRPTATEDHAKAHASLHPRLPPRLRLDVGGGSLSVSRRCPSSVTA